MRIASAIIIVIALAASGLAAASASFDGGKLETHLREQLDRMFQENEYLLDVQFKALPELTKPDSNQALPLPGLGFGALPSESAAKSAVTIDAYRGLSADVLLVVDSEASRERARLAEDVVRRVIDGVGLKERSNVRMRQQRLLKPPVAPPPPPKEPEPPKSLLEQFQEHKEFLVRAGVVAWAALVSLMVIYGLTRRWSTPSPVASPATERTAKNASGDTTGVQGALPGDGIGKPPVAARVKAPAKDELYSKDKAFLDQINDAVSEAKANAGKVAKVLTRWVGLSDENARYAAFFLKNCDIKTVEAVSALLHPADIEKIISQTIEDFDAFGEENQRVLDLMRSDLALLSAERMFKERPDPLNFTKTMSEDEVASLVQGEPLDVVALVATQIPPHRMQKFYAMLSPNELNQVCSLISTMASPSVEQFEVLRDKLLRKAESIGSVLFTDKMRGQTLLQLLLVVPSPMRLTLLAQSLKHDNPTLYAAVRPKIVLPLDLEHLPQRTLTLLTQAVDADVLGIALSGLGSPFTRLSTLLPEAYRVVFMDKLTQTVEEHAQNGAWQKLVGAMRELTGSGMISESELQAARSLADDERGAEKAVGGPYAA